MFRAAALKVLQLGAGAFEVAMMKKPLQPANHLLRTAADECNDLVGTQKTMPVYLPDDVMVAAGQFDRGNRGNALETGQPWRHSATLRESGNLRQTLKPAGYGREAVKSSPVLPPAFSVTPL